MTMKGQIHIYTGRGKGKTTAALGLALRAAGWGKKILIFQFLKPPDILTGEQQALMNTPLPITLKQLDIPWNMATSLQDPAMVEKTRYAIRDTLESLTATARDKTYGTIILDEIVFCLAKGLADIDQIRKLIDERNPNVDIIMTGRDAPTELTELADLVTECKCIKHPYANGSGARKGIDY